MSIKHLTPRKINMGQLIETQLFNILFKEAHKGIPINDCVEIIKKYAETLTPENLKEKIDKKYERNLQWRKEVIERIKNSEITYEI